MGIGNLLSLRAKATQSPVLRYLREIASSSALGGLLAMTFGISCSQFNFSCTKQEPPPTQAWFDASVSDDIQLKRLFHLLPAETEVIILFNPKNFLHEEPLKPLFDRLLSFPAQSSGNGKSGFNIRSFMNLSEQKFLVGVSRKEGQPGLVGLATGPYEKETILNNLRHEAKAAGTTLTELKKENVVIYRLAEDAEWGVAFPSNELMLLGSAETIPSVISKYQSKKPPSDAELAHLALLPVINSPFFVRAQLSPGDNADIREIQAAVRMDKEWELAVKLVCRDEKSATTLKSYLSANQIMGNQMGQISSELLQFFLKTRFTQEGPNLFLQWRLQDIPWEALITILANLQSSP